MGRFFEAEARGTRWVATLPTQQLGFLDGYVQSDSQSEPEELLALAAKVIELLPTLMRDIAFKAHNAYILDDVACFSRSGIGEQPKEKVVLVKL